MAEDDEHINPLWYIGIFILAMTFLVNAVESCHIPDDDNPDTFYWGVP